MYLDKKLQNAPLIKKNKIETLEKIKAENDTIQVTLKNSE